MKADFLFFFPRKAGKSTQNTVFGEYNVLERTTAGNSSADTADFTYPCGETQEVFYELLFDGEHHPLDSHRFAYSRLEKRRILRERFQRLWLTYLACALVLLV